MIQERLGDRGPLRVTTLAALSGIVDGQVALCGKYGRHSQHFVEQRPAWAKRAHFLESYRQHICRARVNSAILPIASQLLAITFLNLFVWHSN